MIFKIFFLMIIVLFEVRANNLIGRIPQYEIDIQKKCVSGYLDELKIKRPTKEMLSFTKKHNGDSVLMRIKKIAERYKNINNYDTLEHFCDDLGWYCATITTYEYYQICLNSKLSDVSYSELKECKDINSIGEDTKIDSKCKLYYLFYMLLSGGSLLNVGRYQELLNKVKDDRFIMFNVKFDRVLEKYNVPFSTIETAIDYINTSDKESQKKIFTWSETQIN